MLPRVMRLISEEWQEIWDCCADNNMLLYQLSVSTNGKHLYYVVILYRLRIGHTHLTHSYLLSGDDQPECDVCQCPFTVKHIMIECVDLQDVWNKHFVVSSMKDLFENVAITENC